MPSEDTDWTWKFAPRAADQFDGLDTHIQDRIVSKLDEVVTSEWRDPSDYLEPLTGGPFENTCASVLSDSHVFSTTRRVCSQSIASNTEAARTRPTIESFVERP